MAASPIPRGIEVLVKKASVDPGFRRLLLDRRAAAAAEIGLELDPAEAAMLQAIPAAQLESTIEHTTVSPMTRAAFLGKAAALMLAALGAQAGADGPPPPGGIAPDRPKYERSVLYSEADYRGRLTYAVLGEYAYPRKEAEAAKKNVLLRHAFAAAQKAWRGEPGHEGVAFALAEPQPFRLNRIGSYIQKDEAEKVLSALQRQLDQKTEAAEKAEAERLATMSEADLARERARKAQMKAAEALFEKELQRLLNAPPPVTRGITPDIPPPVGGIRP